MTLTVKPEISLNTVIALAAVGLGIYMFYKVKNVASDTVDDVQDWWDGVDLNPFDSQGTIGKTLETITKTPAIVESLEVAAKKALAAKGKNISNYILYFPKAGEKLPADSWKVTYQSKTYYYIPKTSVGVFGTFITL